MQGKKFPFFDVETEPIKSNTDITLDDITPIQMYSIDSIIFMFAKVKKHNVSSSSKLIRIFNDKIVDDYLIYNKQFLGFKIHHFQHKYYFTTIGVELNNQELCVSTSIKIFEASRLLDRNYKPEKDNLDNFLLKKINLMKFIKTGQLYIGKHIPGEVEHIQDVTSFAISEDMIHCAFGINEGQVILIKGYPNLMDCQDKNLQMRYMTNIDTDKHILNLAFSTIKSGKENITVLYATTSEAVYYFYVMDKSDELNLLNQTSGAYDGCIDVKGDKLIIATSIDMQILEYYSLDMGPSLFFEGRKKYIKYFKTYIIFVIVEDKTNTLAIYDRENKFFNYYHPTFTQVYSLCHDNNNVYAIVSENNSRKLIKLKEKDNKYKFEIFYKRSFYDDAYEYAKNLNYDKKKISEINRRHGDHVYSKGDYNKAIEQYVLTINYLDPSYVIQKFLDGSKLEYLMLYLEALHKDDNFQSRTLDEITDYTALLLNCYIKMKHIDKLKEFVEDKKVSTQVINVETAIEVCKDTEQIDLALSIAKKADFHDNYISLQLDYKLQYSEAMEYLKAIEHMSIKYKIIIKYGSKFLANLTDETQKFIKEIVSKIIQLKKSKNDTGINYEELIKIYLNQEKYLEDLVDYIMLKDDDCSSLILHR